MQVEIGSINGPEKHTIELPMLKHELTAKLNELCGTDEAEEIVVYDLPGLYLNCTFNYDDIYEVNALAFVYENDYDDDYDDAVNAWIDQYGHSLDAIEVANLMLNADEIPWHTYNGYDGDTPEERFGRMWLNEIDYDAMRELDAIGLVSHIDYESYGKDKAQDCALYENGYLDMAEHGPNTYDYDLDELQERYGYEEEE